MSHAFDLTMTFENSKTFQAVREAEEWCAALGLSVGAMQRGQCHGEGFMFNALCTPESCGYYADHVAGETK